MSTLFETGKIGGMVVPNRFVRSATWEGMAADDGAVTARLIETMDALAKGGVGLIISSHAYVSPEGQAGRWQLGIYRDELMEGLRRMTDAVHASSGRIVAQLAHAGYLGVSAPKGQVPVVVSDFEGLMTGPRREIAEDDLQRLLTAYVDAARRAKASGFDGIQLHAAHGYLLNQFLSPAFNRRRDAYGGSVGNRARFLLDILRAVRDVVGRDFPILAKLNSQDFIENGLTLGDSMAVVELLANAGIDAIELSGGMVVSGDLSPSRTGINKPEKEAYFRQEARAIKERVSVPLMLVGGLRSLEVAEQLIAEGVTDYISMCRPFIREPGLINRWKGGDRRKATCLSDNQCFVPAMEGKGIFCVVEERERMRKAGTAE